MTEIKVVDALSPEIREKMEKDLVKYESENGIDVNYKRFSFSNLNTRERILKIPNSPNISL